MKEKIMESIIKIAFLWICVWSMAVDTPGEGGWIAIGLTMLGVAVLGGVLLFGYVEEKRPPKRSKTNNNTNK